MHAEVGPAYGRLREAFEDTRERAAGITGTLRIGLYTPVERRTSYGRDRACVTVRYPACEVVFVNTGLNENPLSWVRTGRVDLLATRLPITQPDIAIGPVLYTQSGASCSSRVTIDSPSARRSSTRTSAIARSPTSPAFLAR